MKDPPDGDTMVLSDSWCHLPMDFYKLLEHRSCSHNFILQLPALWLPDTCISESITLSMTINVWLCVIIIAQSLWIYFHSWACSWYPNNLYVNPTLLTLFSGLSKSIRVSDVNIFPRLITISCFEYILSVSVPLTNVFIFCCAIVYP